MFSVRLVFVGDLRQWWLLFVPLEVDVTLGDGCEI